MTSPVQPGDVLLGKYRVERVLGQGGMGVVVAARHIDLGELFAIKFLLPAALAQADAVERFLREARASARLKGEHVVKVQDVGRLPDGMPYMVMEHLAGSDLKEVVRQRGPLPPAEAIAYVLQACDALAEAHSLGVVHRDLKPANLFLVRRPNGSPCVKVLDFGISKQIEPETAEQQALTRTGMILGSPLYMSPEQMMRTKEADPRGDIWSMGVVLYQLLTGTVPFRAEVLTELVGKVLQEEPLPPSHHRPDLPPAVDAVVMQCLQKRREHRFQTVPQLIEALRAAQAALAAPLPPRAPLPSYPQVAALPPPVPVASNAGVGPSAVVLTGPVAQTVQAWGTTSIQGAPRPSRAGLVFFAVAAVMVVAGGLAAWRFAGSREGGTASAEGPPPIALPTGSGSLEVTPSGPAAPPVTGGATGTAAPADSPAPAATGTAAPADTPGKPAVTGAKPATGPTAVPPGTRTPAPLGRPTAAPTGKKHDSMY